MVTGNESDGNLLIIPLLPFVTPPAPSYIHFLLLDLLTPLQLRS